MADPTTGLEAFQAACAAIVEGGRPLLRWEWDDYVGAALSPFPQRDAPVVHALLAAHFTRCWSPDTIAGAPPAVRALEDSFGGLRGGQELFASDPQGGVTMFGCWWPWGSGDRVSVRIGLAPEDGSEAQQARMRGVLRAWFSL